MTRGPWAGWLALMAPVWAVRTGVMGNKPLLVLLPFLDWSSGYRLEKASMPLILIFLMMALHAFFPGAIGVVTIRAEAVPGFVRLAVEDTGEGIGPELLPHVFKRFVRGDGEGMGLGLPICKEIVEAHGGRIGIESRLGSGTCMWFTLPANGKEETGHE